MVRAVALAIVLASSVGCAKKDPPAVGGPGTPGVPRIEITIRASPILSRVDRDDPIHIVAAVSDDTGRMISGHAVELESSMEDDVLAPSSGVTRASGAFVATLTGTTPGTRRVTARAGDASATVEVRLSEPICGAGMLVGGQPPSLLDWPLTSRATALLVGDLDDDGREDLVVTLMDESFGVPNERIIVRLRGGGDGEETVLAQTWPSYIFDAALADLDRDGRLDLVVHSQDPGGHRLDVALGNGDGTFRAAATPIDAGDMRRWFIAKRVSGDDTDRLVLVSLPRDGPAVRAQVFTLDEEGEWELQASADLVDAIDVDAAGDFDGDGWVDLAVKGREGLEIWFGSGDGSFSEGFRAQAVASLAADFDHDGRTDLLVRGGESFDVWLGREDRTFVPNELSLETLDRFFLGAWDLDRDGQVDLFFVDATMRGKRDRTLVVVPGDGAGGFGRPIDLGPLPIENIVGFAAVDLDYGELAELAFLGWRGLFHLPAPAEKTNGFPASLRFDGRPTMIAAGDFFCDGTLDLALSIPNGGVQVYRVDAAGVREEAGPFAIGSSVFAMAAGDLDGDGVDELLLAGSRLDLGIVSVNTRTERWVAGSNSFPILVGTSDLDGDGRTDVFLVNNTTIETLLAEPDGSFRHGPLTQTESFADVAAVGDFDGDGRLDVAVTGSWTTILLGDGSGGFEEARQLPMGGTSLSVADLDLDGRDDLIVGYFDQVIILWSGSLNDESTSLEAPNVPTPFAGDFDGDLHPDIAILGPGDSITIFRGIGDRTFHPPASFPAGGFPLSLLFGNFTGGELGDFVVVHLDGSIHLMPLACGE